MARIDRARLAAAQFPVTVRIPVRFDDLDIQWHVNNAAAVVLLQEGRVMFNRDTGLAADAEGLRVMVAGLTVDYAGEMRFPEPVDVATGVLAIGRTSFTLAQLVRQGGEPRLFAEVVMVIADANGPTPIPERLRSALAARSIAERMEGVPA